MNITLNNNLESFDEARMTVLDLLRIKNFTFKMLVVKINGNLVRKEDYDSTFISDSDHVTVLHLISGG
ncbi:MAG: sulfur carrier protein ThiS [Bacteroidetes bacterium]|nr:sulfur carrier protein ThiS [Bacteroidota bacterium]